MKGVILAGGKGTRLNPLTQSRNKHLVPVFNKEMIFYPLETMKKSGVEKVLIVSGSDGISEMARLLGSGSQLGMSLSYKVQDEAGGIAEALSLAGDFIGEEDEFFPVLLGDNIFEKPLDFLMPLGIWSAKVYLKKVKDIRPFGSPTFRNGRIKEIIEKPKRKREGMAVVGAYLFHQSVFAVIPKLKKSARGELEITAVTDYYAKKQELYYNEVDGFWDDAGTFEGLQRCNLWAKRKTAKGKV